MFLPHRMTKVTDNVLQDYSSLTYDSSQTTANKIKKCHLLKKKTLHQFQPCTYLNTLCFQFFTLNVMLGLLILPEKELKITENSGHFALFAAITRCTGKQ